MNRKELIDALKWQHEAGVTESFGEFTPLKDLKKLNIGPIKNTEERIEAISNNAIIEDTKIEKSSFQNFMETKTPSYNSESSVKDFEEYIEEAKKLASNAKNLEELRGALESFEGLSIKKLAHNTVFSDGNPKAKLMLIGEAPGQNEDEQGIPFCGVSGRLLDKIFKYGGYKRDGKTEKDSFYITNTVFWRPPGNRKPLPEELAMCKPFVEKHIALIDPKVIVLVGGTAVESILATKDSVTKLRKDVHKYYSDILQKDIDCFVIYHPSYLLRQPSQKKNAWNDMLKIKKYIENL